MEETVPAVRCARFHVCTSVALRPGLFGLRTKMASYATGRDFIDSEFAAMKMLSGRIAPGCV